MALKELRERGECQYEGCEHVYSEYIVRIELNRLGAKDEAMSCRQHVGDVASDLAASLREWVRRSVKLAEIEDECELHQALQEMARETG